MRKFILILLLALSVYPYVHNNHNNDMILFMPNCLEVSDIVGTWGKLSEPYAINNMILYDTVKWTIIPGRYSAYDILCIKEISSSCYKPSPFGNIPNQVQGKVRFYGGTGTDELDYGSLKFRRPEYEIIMIQENGVWEKFFRFH